MKVIDVTGGKKLEFKIEKIVAFVASDKNGEGIIGQLMSNGVFMPFIGADEEKIKALYPLAKKIVNSQKQELKILEFSVRTDITEEVIKKYDN